jgi:uncharacterized protein YecT (DUF1311 family)
MKIFFLGASKKLMLLCLVFCLCINVFSQNQGQMNEEAYMNYKKVDNELGVVYQKIISKYANKTEFINALRASERLWIQFRDAELKMKFPAANPKMEYGSMYPMCFSSYLQELTIARINQLKRWLKPPSEGEACNGSLGDF